MSARFQFRSYHSRSSSQYGLDTKAKSARNRWVSKIARLALFVPLAGAFVGFGGNHQTVTPAARTVRWPAPKDPMTLTRRAGLVPELYEYLTYHVHAHLDVFVNGQPVTVPAGLGINIHDPGVHTFKTPTGNQYGGIQMCRKPCISPLHTHDASGILHTETARPQPNRLGQAFVEWGVRLSSSCVDGYCRPHSAIAVYVNGKQYSGNPNDILLSNHKEIAVVVGTPPKHIPSSYAWNQ